MPEITVRPALRPDVEMIVDYNRRLAWESEHKELDERVLRAGVERALGTPGLCAYYLATIDELPVGQTMVTYELTDWRDGVLWWIQSVYVEEAFRRQGVFRALFQHIEREARASADVRGIRLYVDDENHRAWRTYESLGLKPSGHSLLELDWSGAVKPAET